MVSLEDGAVTERVALRSSRRELRVHGPAAGYLWFPLDDEGLILYPTSGDDPLAGRVDLGPALAEHRELGEGFEATRTTGRGLVLRGPVNRYVIEPDGSIERFDGMAMGDPRPSARAMLPGLERAATPDGAALSVDDLLLRDARMPTDAEGQPMWVADPGGVLVLGRSIRPEDRRRDDDRLVLLRPDGEEAWNVSARDLFGTMKATLRRVRPRGAVFLALRPADGRIWAAIQAYRESRDDDGSTSVHHAFLLVEIDPRTGEVRRRVRMRN
jgi:hypothetical protein